jgi:hypothetical protein
MGVVPTGRHGGDLPSREEIADVLGQKGTKSPQDHLRRLSPPILGARLGTFVDRIGGALLWPFSLYITPVRIGAAQVGGCLGYFALGIVAVRGGALTDYLGRNAC